MDQGSFRINELHANGLNRLRKELPPIPTGYPCLPRPVSQIVPRGPIVGGSDGASRRGHRGPSQSLSSSRVPRRPICTTHQGAEEFLFAQPALKNLASKSFAIAKVDVSANELSGRHVCQRCCVSYRPRFAILRRNAIDSDFVGRPRCRGSSSSAGGSYLACHSRTTRADHLGPRSPGTRVAGGNVSGQALMRL